MGTMLVAVDGSDASHKAVLKAVEWASKTKDTLLLCHVCVPVVYPAETAWVRSPEIDLVQREQGENILKKWAAEVREKGVAVNTKLVEGPAAESLLECADSEKVDLIVVGSRGRNALARVLLGSVADRIVHLSKRPVMVVH